MCRTLGATTYCPGCHAPLIVRDWHEVEACRLTPDGRCPDCATPIAGRFEAFERRRIPVWIGR